jgi:hypothetical protein
MAIWHGLPQSLQVAVSVDLLKRPLKLASAFLSRISNTTFAISYSVMCRLTTAVRITTLNKRLEITYNVILRRVCVNMLQWKAIRITYFKHFGL